ncbi:group II intron maturase-specific domain-containing protein [Actinoplanes derwentensis]|uniref:group II intron maturase-specific domain-containing protein n=1 Tax=Actinoplanes derwentensis TaxID=113562 RepID=UPI001E5CC237|nr:group II intron maturase-specific domain-containing protein [Actinoplanes derwentensis]
MAVTGRGAGRSSQQDLGYMPIRLNQVMHGWADYFRHAVAKDTFSMLKPSECRTRT